MVAGVRPCATLRFRSNSEKAKLAAIEIEATADQTAAEILTAIKTVETVDGAGSELDSRPAPRALAAMLPSPPAWR